MNTCIESLIASLEADVRGLCLPHGRRVGTTGHGVARGFVARRLAETGCLPYRGDSFALPFANSRYTFTNFAGVIPGADRSLPPLLVGAHYDSVIDAPCADDNGSAVALVLALATMVRERGGLERDLLVTIFDSEEPPYFDTVWMGSNHFAAHQLDPRGVHAALVWDLVGHDVDVPGLEHLVFMTGAESHPALPDLVEATPVPPSLGLVATLNRYVGDMSDHGAFRRRGTPYLFFSCGRWRHYHRPTDTPDRLNYRKLAHLTRHSLDLAEKLARQPLPPATGPVDTVAFEARSFHRALGPLADQALELLHLRKLDSRRALDLLASEWLSQGL